MKLSKFIFDVLLRRRSTTLVVRKTDDELTRYIKQTNLIKRRTNFEQQLDSELLSKKDFMNTAEIRRDFYTKLRN